jgi:hypothetical protein
MAFIVEDGTGVPNSNALINLVFANEYFSDTGVPAWAALDDAAKQTAIVRATNFLCSAYRWSGTRLNGRTQALAWPRAGVSDFEGNSLPASPLPLELRKACAEIALQEATNPGSMSPAVIPSAAVKREKVGELEVEYLNAQTSVDAARPVLLSVRDLIGQFLASDSSSGSVMFGRSVLV